LTSDPRARYTPPGVRSVRWAVAMLGLMACDGWPLWRHLPEDEPGVPVGEDPRAGVEVEWESVSAEDVDQPPGAVVALGAEGALITGELAGVGWSDLAVPTELVGPVCASRGSRAPATGDWIADVDAFSVDVPFDGVLCARVLVADEDTGIDFVAWSLDDCDIPRTLLADATGPLGLGGAGPATGWSAAVSAGQRLSVVLAAYAPNDAGRSLPYTLGFAMRAADAPLCPLLPSEVDP
jgi:hypothetical protein